MSPPAPQINTFMKVNNKPVIDSISKIFFIAELFLGVNRLPLLSVTKKIYYLPMFCLSVFIYIFLICVVFEKWKVHLLLCMQMSDVLRYIICNILAFVLNSRLIKLYVELKKYNEDVNYETKNVGNRIFVINNIMMFISVIFSFFCVYKYWYNLHLKQLFSLLFFKFFHYLEMNYYGYLFKILIPRITLISNYLKLSYPFKNKRNELNISHRDEELNRFKKIIKNKSNLDMAQIMKLYQRILQIHNCLYQAIKWQMLTTIILSFTNLLVLLYQMFTYIINKETLDNLWLNVSITLIELVPLSTPCILADQVSREVHQLKDLLASKLYENSLDKSSRSTARALLTLMKTHDMSFTLFHMFDINLALPIKFCALLLTYVIIMMQFNKVLNQSN